MVRRKVQITGTSTYAISLPKQWVVKQGIKAGQELNIDETSEGSLIVKTGKAAEEPPRTTVLRVGEFGDYDDLKRTIFARYLAGYETIRIVSSEPLERKVHEVVLSVLERTTGLEITDENDREVTLQNFFSPAGFSIKKMMKRAQMISYSMQKNAFQAFLTNDAGLAAEVEGRDGEVNKIYFLVRRELELASKDSALLRELGLEARDTMDYIVLMRNIEHIADTSRDIAQNIGVAAKTLARSRHTGELEKLNWESMELGREAVEAFFSNDVAAAHVLIRKGHLLEGRLSSLRKNMLAIALAKRDTPEMAQLRTELLLIRTITEYAVEIAELVVDRMTMIQETP